MEKRHKGLSAIHLTLMALGTVIGGSFFLGSAVAVRAAGPSVIISYILGGILVYFILFSLSEMTVADPDYGSFRTLAEKTFGPGLGFVTGWVYWTGLVLAISSEAVALSVFLRVWVPNIPLPVMGSTIIIIITALNLLGADKLSKLESSLVSIKLLAILGFILLGIMLIFGVIQGVPRIGTGALRQEPWFPAGIGGIAGSMLMVMFTYAGFEIISLAASETSNPHKTVPKAIAYTVISLVVLYIGAIVVLLPLLPISSFTQETSPMIQALTRWNLGWTGRVMDIVLIAAIFSTMLAAMFGLGRMIRSLANEGHAPQWLKDNKDIPYKGILFSGLAMLIGLFSGFILPKQVYIFLVSSGGFSLLFTYLVILVTHYKFRKKNGCPPEGNCQLPGYPYSSWIAIISLIVIILSMPLVPGQGYGLLAGVTLIILFVCLYLSKKYLAGNRNVTKGREPVEPLGRLNPQAQLETSEELTPEKSGTEEKNER